MMCVIYKQNFKKRDKQLESASRRKFFFQFSRNVDNR